MPLMIQPSHSYGMSHPMGSHSELSTNNTHPSVCHTTWLINQYTHLHTFRNTSTIAKPRMKAGLTKVVFATVRKHICLYWPRTFKSLSICNDTIFVLLLVSLLHRLVSDRRSKGSENKSPFVDHVRLFDVHHGLQYRSHAVRILLHTAAIVVSSVSMAASYQIEPNPLLMWQVLLCTAFYRLS